MPDNARRKVTFEELSAASERVLQEDHPNPDRIGCPERSALERLATFSEEDPPFDQEILRHVTSECFPCYRELRELRAKKIR
jgi:hypothetical protein